MEGKEKKTPNEAAQEIVDIWKKAGCEDGETDETDALGSYTGMACDGEKPEQDAGDL